jgi:hypothetical protein
MDQKLFVLDRDPNFQRVLDLDQNPKFQKVKQKGSGSTPKLLLFLHANI